jgi:hypothetical protein
MPDGCVVSIHKAATVQDSRQMETASGSTVTLSRRSRSSLGGRGLEVQRSINMISMWTGQRENQKKVMRSHDEILSALRSGPIVVPDLFAVFSDWTQVGIDSRTRRYRQLDVNPRQHKLAMTTTNRLQRSSFLPV